MIGLRDPEIEDLQHEAAAVRVTAEKQILRFDIAVGDAERVRLAETTAGVRDDAAPSRRARGACSDEQRTEILAGEKLHGDVRRPSSSPKSSTFTTCGLRMRAAD